MYEIRSNEQRYHFQNDWLSAFWHFSFDHYYDPDNVGFGALRVFNDDTIQPGKGFPTHSHREMEIVTYVLEGELEHRDSTGGHGTIGAGEVQRMTAGTGIRHSEFNASQEKSLHLLQIWVPPSERNLKPGYEQKSFPSQAREAMLLPIVSGRGDSGALHIHQDTVFYVSTLAPAAGLFETRMDRRAYLFVLSGSVQVGEYALETGATARIWQEQTVPLKAREKSEILLIDLP